MNRKTLRWGAAAGLWLAFLAAPTQAQEYRGRLQGVVSDSSDAAVVGATVVLRSVTTGSVTTRLSSETGHYLFDLLEPGAYVVEASFTGFNRVVQDGINVPARGDVTVNLTLTPGAVSETVTVSSDVGTVEFNSSKIETTIDSKLMNSLPNMRRNPFLMASLDASVAPAEGFSDLNPFHSWGANRASIGGGGAYGNNLQVDGSQVSVGVKTGYVPAPDSVMELTVLQNPVDAEYGYSVGGAVSVVLKSGSNEWHGTGFYQGQFPWANAMEDRHYRTVNLTRNHMFGGTLGNAIKKNKLFNFFSWEQWKMTSPNSVVSTVPSDLERGGNFSQTLNSQGGLDTIYDPWTTKTAADGSVTRTPFTGNIIPASRFDRVAAMYMPDLWKANLPGTGPDKLNNFAASSPYSSNYKNFSDRVDYNVNDKLRLYGRVSLFRTPESSSNPTGSPLYAPGGANRDSTSYSGDVVYTLNERTVLNIHGDWHGFHDDAAFPGDLTSSGGWSKYWPDSSWYKPLFPSGIPIFTPRMTVKQAPWTTLANMGEGSGYWYQHPDGDSFNVKIARQQGAHYLKFGAETIGNRSLSYLAESPGFAFYQELTSSTYVNPDLATSGNGYATFLLGALEPNGWGWNEDSFFPIQAVKKPRNRYFGGYVNDDWKVSRRLTVNLGLRYEYEQPFSDPENRAPRYLDLNSPIPEMQANPPQMPALVSSYYNGPTYYNGAFLFTDSNNRGEWNGGRGVILPKLGMAYRLNDKTALRAAWGRYVAPWAVVSTAMTSTGPTSLMGQSYPGFDATSSPAPLVQGVPQMTVGNPFPSSYPLTLPVGKSLGRYTGLGDSVSWADQDRKRTMSDRFSFSVQRQLPWRSMVDITYYFNRTSNATATRDLNAVDPRLIYQYGAQLNQMVDNPFYGYMTADKFPGPLRYQQQVSVLTLMKPYPQYGSLTVNEYKGGLMHYHSLQVKLQKTYSNGLSLLATYNYHRETDQSFYDDIATYLQDYTWRDSGNSRHRLSGSGSWELPIGTGRRFMSHAPRLLDALVGGWNLSSVLSWRSGSYVGFGAMLVTGDPMKDVPAGYYFNPKVFAHQPDYTPRSNPWFYDGLTGPGMFDLDAALAKDFAISEKVKFQARMDAFNALNGFTQDGVNSDVSSSDFGKSVGQYPETYGRRLQLGMKLIF